MFRLTQKLYFLALLTALCSTTLLAQTGQPPAETKHLEPLIGSWSMIQERLTPQGQWIKQPQNPTWTFEWVMEGHALLDRWESMALVPNTQDSIAFHGLNLRIYDPKTEKWNVIWVETNTRRFANFEGTSESGEFRMQGTNVLGREVKVRFFDFAADSFKWEQAWTFNQGRTWVVVSRMTGTRISKQ